MKQVLYFALTGVVLGIVLYLFFDYEINYLIILVVALTLFYGAGRFIRNEFEKKDKKEEK